jgi:hypothetical protein
MTDITGTRLQDGQRELKKPNGVIASNGLIHERTGRKSHSLRPRFHLTVND